MNSESAYGIIYNQNSSLQNKLVEIQNENHELLKRIISTEESLIETESLLNILRDKYIKAVNLPGHAPVAPEAFAKVFYNQTTQTVHLDARGLPELPEGMVCQVWALKMDPLTPTSIGLLDDFTIVENKKYLYYRISLKVKVLESHLNPQEEVKHPHWNNFIHLG